MTGVLTCGTSPIQNLAKTRCCTSSTTSVAERRCGLNMADDPAKPDESPEGAAVFPLIPAELGVHPLLLAAVHAYVFLEGSDAGVLNPAVADEAMQYLVTYLQRLGGE